MGRTLNFFDFSGGRRHSSSNDLKVPRNCSDVSNETLTGHMNYDNRQEKKFTYEMTKASTAKKKAVGMPMKTLIAQEMSRKETDSKSRTPSVIARLMGLDALPTESVVINQTKEEVNHTKKKQSWRQQQQSKSTVDVRDSLQKAKDSERKITQHIFTAKTQQHAVDKPDGERVLRDNPCLYTSQCSHKMQQQKFKKDIETWEASKFQDDSVSNEREKPCMKTVGNQMLKYAKLNEQKMALVRKKFMDAKRLATDVNLQKSKEFLDAVEILQSNKDAFLEFLEQPNALLAKQIRDSEFSSQSQSQSKQITVLKSCNAIRTSQWVKEDNNRERSLKKQAQNEKNLRRQKVQRDFGEKKETREVVGLPPSRPDSASLLPDQYNKLHSTSRNSSESLPTRIVVLKPGPGRVQNLQSDSTPSYSPRYQTCTGGSREMERTKTQDYLQGVRMRLEMEIRKNSENKSNTNNKKDVEKRFGNELINHREIASDIARHLRQSLAKDVMNDAPAGVLRSSSDCSGNISRSRLESGYEDVDQEVYTPVSKLSLGSSDRFSLPSPSVSAVSDSSESTVNREAKRRLLERWKSTHRNEEEQQQRVSSTLAEMLALPERMNQVSGSKSLKENNKTIMSAEGCEVPDILKLERKNKKSAWNEGAAEWEGSLVQRNEADDGNISSRNFQRSRSVPVSSTTYDGGIIEMQWKAPILDARNTHVIDYDKSSNSLSDYDKSSSNLSGESINSKNDKSISKGKVSSIKCNILMRGKWSNNKKLDSLDFVQPCPDFQFQSDKELSISMEQRAEKPDRYKQTIEPLSTFAQQESCEVLRDAPEEITETDDCSVGAISENSGLDDDGYDQPTFESSVKDPIPFECQETLSCIGADRNTRAISSVAEPEFPSPCSPIKKLPVFENHVPEINIDKGEHPSPVSVLDCSFQEDFSSPNEFKEISSNLHELRLQLHLLKCEGLERPVHKSENLLHGDSLHFKDHKIGDEDIMRENNCNTPSEAETPHRANNIFSAIEKFNIESLRIDGICCSEEQLPDLLYIRDVLLASGFIGDCNTIFARWHSPSNPLDPHLYDKLEDLYKDTTQSKRNFSGTEFAEVSASIGIKAHRSRSERHLLYDCINEVLLEILGSFLNRHSWVGPTKMNLKPMAAGKQLLKETWARICQLLYPRAEVHYTLENLVTNDLSRETVWMELKGDMEITGHEIERAIFNDLIEGILCDLVS